MLRELADEALKDDYQKELFLKAELAQANRLFQIEFTELKDKEFIDLLRFADILSHGNNSVSSNISYKIISLLAESHEDDETFQVFANSIMTRLGNFPALNYLTKSFNSEIRISFETLLETSVKEVYQKIPNSDLIFTDSQYKIYESLKNNNHFSFSGPTSLGKSFILNAFIEHLIKVHRRTDNIAVLVPSRALINQTVARIKEQLKDQKNYSVLSHPTIPGLLLSEENKYVFVFTPERLISYLSEFKNPKIDYLFVDEAHKIVAINDTRNPIFYHAILLAERKSVKLYFASPNVKNPEVFLRIFEKSTDETLALNNAPVSQNRYFLDLVEKKCISFSDTRRDFQIRLDFTNNSLNYWLLKIGKLAKNIVYCNSKNGTIIHALEFAKDLKNKKSKSIDSAIELIKEHLHQSYFLIDCLRKGVAYHFGNLPQVIREKIEELFEQKEIDFLFCTSTLLEGVNLPAKNIFILNNKIGTSKFTELDFWNLAGRAGRLTKEMYGNIICLRSEKNHWKYSKDLDIVRFKNISTISPLIEKGQGNFYKNIENSILNRPFTKKNASQNQKDIWNTYGNLALLHEIRQDESVLRSKFIDKNPNGYRAVQNFIKKVQIPDKILSKSSMIKAIYQNDIYNEYHSYIGLLPEKFDFEIILKKLELISLYYNWEKEESGGRNPLYPNRGILRYYANIMNDWMSAKPLKLIIKNAIDYYTKRKTIYDPVERSEVYFDPNDKRLLNVVINEIIYAIDNTLRFKIKNYFENYYNILKNRFGLEAGANWADYIEYGTTDFRVIELQNLGLPRHLAQYILKNHNDHLEFDQKTLAVFKTEKILKDFDKKRHEFLEFKSIFHL
jgi:superfamily II DNA or RNA helicase